MSSAKMPNFLLMGKVGESLSGVWGLRESMVDKLVSSYSHLWERRKEHAPSLSSVPGTPRILPF